MDQMPIPGWGVDRRIEDRPGYPLEQERRVAYDTVAGRPPYADTVPLHGLSGVLRRAAYRQPDWKARRWLLLMLADRLDVVESKLTLRNLIVAGGLVGAATAIGRRLHRRR